ncbi:uncharacterized protein CIMG_12779 [Coccidioides immitis RS]|uniref:Uncharacterized protein n=1 Tax=Coccidioides immitis (strain RS) TaxID=246410 RepID=A0A0D8JSR0_COCIM|nr:uncharacterized protein CIMG_12779 [Coccidioides immitis RS]KJF60149.1 hypothetical protein CIMG_12779 [Coccidioides immitis RS]
MACLTLKMASDLGEIYGLPIEGFYGRFDPRFSLNPKRRFYQIDYRSPKVPRYHFLSDRCDPSSPLHCRFCMICLGATRLQNPTALHGGRKYLTPALRQYELEDQFLSFAKMLCLEIGSR